MQFTEKAELFREWMLEKNVEDIEIIDISNLSSDIDVFVIGTALNDRHAKSVAEFIQEKAEEQGFEILNKEGLKSSKWILLDFIDVVVHLFLKDERELYNLEKIWADGNFLQRKN